MTSHNKFCQDCGTENEREWAKCRNCGYVFIRPVRRGSISKQNLVIGALVGFLIIALTLYALTRTTSQSASTVPVSEPAQPRRNTISGSAFLTFTDGTSTVLRGLEIDVISPADSFPARSIINHFGRAQEIALAGIPEAFEVLDQQVRRDLDGRVAQSVLSDENGAFVLKDVPEDAVIFAQFHSRKDYFAWKLNVPNDGGKVLLTNANRLQAFEVIDPARYIDTYKFGGRGQVLEIRAKGFRDIRAWMNELNDISQSNTSRDSQ